MVLVYVVHHAFACQGHIGFLVDNLEEHCQAMENAGVKFVKRPQEGKMHFLAFAQDPGEIDELETAVPPPFIACSLSSLLRGILAPWQAHHFSPPSLPPRSACHPLTTRGKMGIGWRLSVEARALLWPGGPRSSRPCCVSRLSLAFVTMWLAPSDLCRAHGRRTTK